MRTSVTVTAEAELTPEQVAEAFWNLSSDEQADFFHHLGMISGGMLGLQATFIRDACKAHEHWVALDSFQKLGAGAYWFGALNEPATPWEIPGPNNYRTKVAA